MGVVGALHCWSSPAPSPFAVSPGGHSHQAMSLGGYSPQRGSGDFCPPEHQLWLITECLRLEKTSKSTKPKQLPGQLPNHVLHLCWWPVLLTAPVEEHST